MKYGDAFIGGKSHHGNDHLWIIINDPARHGGEALFVNVTSLRGTPLDDRTCELAAGDHPFVSKPSYIRFNGARCAPAVNLDRAIKSGVMQWADPATPQLIERIRHGALASAMLSPDKKELL